jgi:exonuclease III
MPSHISPIVSSTILSWNCNSLNGKLKALNDLINPILHPHSNLPALIALCELRLKPYHFSRCPPRLNDYLFVTASLADQPGTGFFIHSSLAHRHRTDLPRPHSSQQQFMDICWLQIRLPQQSSDILIASIYVNTNHTDFDSNQHWNVLHDCLLVGLETGKRMIVVGDFNARHIELGDIMSNHHGKRLVNIIADCGLLCVNRELARGIATRPRSNTVIDLVFTSEEELITSLRVDTKHDCLLSTDHLPLLIQLQPSSFNSYTNGVFGSSFLQWRWQTVEATDENWSHFKHQLDIQLTKLKETMPLLDGTDAAASIECMWSNIRDCIVSAGDTAIGRTPFYGTIELVNHSSSSSRNDWFRKSGVATIYNEMKHTIKQARRHPSDSWY